MQPTSGSSLNRPARWIPPADESPAPRAAADRTQCIAAWFDLVEATDQILLAALRSRNRTEAEVEAAYRVCHQRQIEEHDRKVHELLLNFNRRRKHHGG
ncbi:MAG: hypothetical protein EXS05_24210 [Planctomycetaceae bacterium]|nr:hypothetical protein [Planctomycetaceae bacterium]